MNEFNENFENQGIDVDQQRELDSRNIFYMQNREEIIQQRIIIIVFVLFAVFIAFIAFKNNQIKKADVNSEAIVTTYEATTEITTAQKSTVSGSSGVVSEDVVENKDLNEFDKYKDSIFCWGDSFSENVDIATNFYGYFVHQKLISRNIVSVSGVYSAGAGNENLISLSGKMGSYPLYTMDFNIPADRTTVEVVLKSSYDNSTVIIDEYSNPGLNPCVIQGVVGNLTSDGQKNYFQRLEAGEEVIVPGKTIVKSNLMENIKEYTSVFFFGDEYTHSPSEAVELYKKIIEATGNENYIIVGSIKGTEKDLARYEIAFEKAFGNHFINLREYLCGSAFDDYEIKINSADLEALKNDRVPASFILKDLRLNDKIAEILGDLVYNKLIELDII